MTAVAFGTLVFFYNKVGVTGLRVREVVTMTFVVGIDELGSSSMYVEFRFVSVILALVSRWCPSSSLASLRVFYNFDFRPIFH